jgi:hypothetical protein
VKFWTNNGKRGCSNPTKTSTLLPSILVLPKYLLPNILISQSERSSGHYIVIETVVVKFSINNGKRGCNNPTKTSTLLPSILVLP